MTPTTRTTRATTLLRWVIRLGALCLLAAMVLGQSPSSQARVRPYYVLKGASFGQINPRILFVFDTSGSMARRAQAANARCVWNDCEDGTGTAQSRIASARSAVNQVIAATADKASFSLMTFGQQTAPTSVPPMCTTAGTRFVWVDQYESVGGTFNNIDHYAGYTGTWRLCQGADQRPFPYLRWDDLGVGPVVTTNNETGAVPASPLISTAQADMSAASNATRKVQWFPEFLGVRVQLNATTDASKTVLNATWGDWGSDAASRDADVYNHDFYYWPYVDGFPGYAQFDVTPTDSGANTGGVASEGANTGQLYAPFYLDLSATAIPPTMWGPVDEAAATQTVLDLTSPLIMGGADADGNTPWATTIGIEPGAPPQDNTAGSHATVASYVKFVTTAVTADACAPTTVVLLSDGEPSGGEGGATLYERIAALRTSMGAKVYVVGFFLNSGEINNMACAGAGACAGGAGCATPCDDTPTNSWDTCSDSADPANACAYLAASTAELVDVLSGIVSQEVQVDLDAGPGTTINDFGIGANGTPGLGERLQTKVTSFTEWPGWQGHVVRELCDDEDSPGVPAAHCTSPIPEFEPEEVEPTFGPCPQSRQWDAGECLQMTAWNDRRIFTNDAAGNLVAISEPDGSASAAFQALLLAGGHIPGVDAPAEADAMVAFILGRDFPDGWKLPGLANAAPVVVRRIPPYRPEFAPSVAIRDPHCAGRVLGEVDAPGVPSSLEDFARDAWDEDLKIDAGGPNEHYEYQEAVLIGDDLGILHAFQFNSGNELWGYLPSFALTNTAAQAAIGAAAVGQPEALDDHIFGLAATVNHGWAFDDTDVDPANHTWRHLGVMGMGAGGNEYFALDLAHMSPDSPSGPFEVMWTSEDAALKVLYDDYNGETWARPALSYHVPGDQLTQIPDTRLVFGSGYEDDVAPGPEEGRTLVMADAMTGTIIENSLLPAIVNPVYEPTFGALVDPAVGSHCISRFWAEMQEVYVTDPAGRLFRWDQGRNTAHESDSTAIWGAAAQAVTRFPACTSTTQNCTVAAGNAGDVFVFSPAVSANDRIDDFSTIANGDPPEGIDQFLVAMASGTPYDDTIDGGDPANDFHSSLYLLVDDHASGPKTDGFNIPAGAPKMQIADVGTQPGYFRVALSDIERTRTYTPYPGATELTETRLFSKAARPVRAPRIFVTGVVDQATAGGPNPVVIEGVEVFFISFQVYEPGTGECDPDFFDSANDEWHFDAGTTYDITFRLTADATQGFNFTTGTESGDADFGGGFEEGLTLVGVEQIDDCPDGNCGPKTSSDPPAPCDNNDEAGPLSDAFAIPVHSTEIVNFVPVE